MSNERASASGNDGGVFEDASAGFVNRVAVRLPPFWPEDPEVWFTQAESHFHVSGIKDDATKFHIILSQLDQRYAKEIKDVIQSPPKTDKYNKLKSELIKRLSISREQQISQLLSHEELGDRKPSQFLRHLKNMAAGGVSDEFLKSMWMNRLPNHVQAIILSQTTSSLEQIADLADKICEVTPNPTPYQVAATSNFDDLLKRMDDLITARIQTELTQQISKLTLQQQRGRSPFRRGDASRSRSRGRSRSHDPGMCWYHNNFGSKAYKCTSPCNFKKGNDHDSQ